MAPSGGITEIAIDRPERANALDLATVRALDGALATAAEDRGTRAVLLRGEGKHFCAGADIGWMRDAGERTPEQNLEEAAALAGMLRRIWEMPKPVVVAAHGKCMGGGAGLCCAADVCVADPGATFSFSEVRLGLEPATVSPYVVRAIGARQARRLFLTGEEIGAGTARNIGLVHVMSGLGEAAEEARALCEKCLLGAPGALASAKGLVPFLEGREVGPELSRLTAERLASIRASEEAQEGARAFLEKRPPGWAGRKR